MTNKSKQNDMLPQKKSNKGLKIFWLAVLSVYGIAFLVNSDLAWRGLRATGQTLIKIIPIIVLVFVIMVFTNLFLTPERVKRHFGHEAGIKGWLYAILFGLLVAGPPYALYPMLKQMKEHGLRTGYLAAFLYNRNIKIPLLPVSVYYFGWLYTITMAILIIIFSILDGWLMEKIMGETKNG